MAHAGTLQLRNLVRDLPKMDPEFRKFVRWRMGQSASEAVESAKSASSWSSRIPRAIGARTRLTRSVVSVSVITRAKQAPHAHAYENKGVPGTFRHPVFGNRRVWVSERARPFLAPAVKPWIDNVDTEMGEVAQLVAEKYDFH